MKKTIYLAIFFLLIWGIFWQLMGGLYEYNVSQVDSVMCNARLISISYIPINTYMGGKTGRSSMSYSEGYVTIWDVEGFGNLTSTNQKIFKHAQYNSVLLIKEYWGQAYIWDIVSYQELEKPHISPS